MTEQYDVADPAVLSYHLTYMQWLADGTTFSTPQTFTIYG